MQQLILGTRGSALALAQTELVARAIAHVWPKTAVTVREIVTSGDRNLTAPTGLKGLFTKELEDALLRREIDVAVHSCKDMPYDMPGGLVLAAVLERADTADVLVSKQKLPLPHGAHVGTSSVRRERQLLLARPDLVLEPIRGNVPTRLRKLRENDAMHATVLARAGLERLGYVFENGCLETESGIFYAENTGMLPAIGQGAIALQCRAEDAAALAALNHEPTWRAIRAERELMRLLNGDCTLPVGVSTETDAAGMRMKVILFGDTSKPPRQADVRAAEPELLAEAASRELTR